MTNKKMKAWKVSHKDDYFSIVVFAETRGKAKYLAQKTEAYESCEFIDLEVRRLRGADCLYKDGRTEVDWYNDNDRLVLVRDCNFRCDEVESEYECKQCPAIEHCDAYSEYQIRQQLFEI